jgi:GNAT superfamily N-acetyltransferase
VADEDDTALRATSPKRKGDVRMLGPRDTADAARVLVRAFHDDPAFVALIPDPETRSRLLRALALARARDAGRYAAAHGVRLEGELAGVALWTPPGTGLRVLPAAATLIRNVLGGGPITPTIAHVSSVLWRDRRVMPRLARARMQAMRAASAEPAWYLALIGTDPRYRRRGVARRLLEHVLERCDADGVPAWLETTEESTVAIYERFGFTVSSSAAAGSHMPGYWVMWRAPRAAS